MSSDLKFDPKKHEQYSSVKVVDGDQIESLAPKGAWRLLGIIEDEVVVQVQKNHVYQTSPGCYPNTHSYYENEIAKRTRFLMGIKYDDAMSNAITRAEQAEREVLGARDNLSAATKELAAEKKAVDITKTRCEQLSSLVSDLEIKRDVQAQRYALLETDLAKVRRAIGEEKFAEIVGKK